MKSRLITVKEYAKRNKLTLQAVYKQVRENRVEHVTQYGVILIKLPIR